MKNIYLMLTAVFTAASCLSQESNTSKETLLVFDKYYNASKYDSVFALFAPQTKINLPLQKTRDFLIQLKSNYGNIVKRTYIESQAPFTVYKGDFEKASLSLSFAIDNNNLITNFLFKPYVEDLSPKLVRNITKMDLPFNGEWTIFWGGDTKEQNQHTAVKFQKNAFDILVTDVANKSFKSTGKKNEDYYAFGREIFSLCDAEVILAVDGIKDNVPGFLNPLFTLGNSVVLKTKHNEYILLAHFKQQSLAVKQGDIVKRGQKIGLCGNSGNSSEPHLHFHIQNIEDFNVATGAKCYFDNILVNGVVKHDYSPVKGDKVQKMK